MNSPEILIRTFIAFSLILLSSIFDPSSFLLNITILYSNTICPNMRHIEIKINLYIGLGKKSFYKLKGLFLSISSLKMIKI